VVIIAAVAACLLAVMWVMRRGQPTWHHVITHEAAKRREEIKAEIESRERGNALKPRVGLSRHARPASERLPHQRRPFALVMTDACSQGSCRSGGWRSYEVAVDGW
jgi:hypothetical protein